MRLSTKEYWDSIYEKQTARGLDNNRTQKQNDITLLKKLFNTRIAEYVKNYDRYILWEVIYRRYMPRIPGLKALEVGSAPGKYLIQLNNRYGFLPYGVEYSPQGVKLNRDYFRLHNLNPDNVIHCDFFSHDFQYQYKGYFDIVVSRGFIEHFTDPKEVVEKHINLLKKDGLLIITIPNYRGINWFILSLFNKKSLSIHNLNIMNKEKFLRLFENEKLHKLYSDYWGTFNFGLFSIPKGTLKYNILNRLKDFQLLLNLIFRLTFKDKEPKTWFLSPHLIYVGQKITD